MKSEIIIAVRGELPQNLLRTIAETGSKSVCVVFDGNERGNLTPEGIPPFVRIERPWVMPRGCGQARDWGIATSKADLVVLIDGHMSFPSGWLDEIEAHHKRRQDALTCCRMRSLTHKWEPYPGDAIYGGAWLCLKSREPDGLQYALSAKWLADSQEFGAVPAVMGACYAFRRAFYERMGSPLSLLEAWGGDEEILSACAQLMGGRVQLLPIVCGHVYAAPYVGRDDNANVQANRWANRHTILDAIPMPDQERNELHAWIKRTHGPLGHVPSYMQRALVVRKILEGGKKTWADLKAAGIVREPTKDEQARILGRSTKIDNIRPVQPAASPQVIVRQPEVCKMCGAVNSFVMLGGYRRFGGMYQSYGQCKSCGHKAHLRTPAR